MLRGISKQILSMTIIAGVSFGSIISVNANPQLDTTCSNNTSVDEYQIPKIDFKPGVTEIDFMAGSPPSTDEDLISFVRAIDLQDGDISNKIRVETNLDIKIPGKYYVHYSVIDKDGNSGFFNIMAKVSIPDSYGEENDWGNHWASKYIQQAMDKGWVCKSDEFRPDDRITRAEVVKILNRVYGYNTKGNIPFNDVYPNDWFYDEVRIALNNNVISYDANFRPFDFVTREEFATMISNIETNKKGDTYHDKYINYKDYNQSSPWARNSIEYVIEKGYMGHGGQVFNPNDSIIRGEVVTALSRVK